MVQWTSVVVRSRGIVTIKITRMDIYFFYYEYGAPLYGLQLKRSSTINKVLNVESYNLRR